MGQAVQEDWVGKKMMSFPGVPIIENLSAYPITSSWFSLLKGEKKA